MRFELWCLESQNSQVQLEEAFTPLGFILSVGRSSFSRAVRQSVSVLADGVVLLLDERKGMTTTTTLNSRPWKGMTVELIQFLWIIINLVWGSRARAV